MVPFYQNKYLIGKIVRYLDQPLKYVFINHYFAEYICEMVDVKFSMELYLTWLIREKVYPPVSMLKLLHWNVSNIYIPSKIFNDLENILQFLRIEKFKKVKVEIEIKNKHLNCIQNLSNRLSSYILIDGNLRRYFEHIDKFIIRNTNHKINLEHFKMSHLDINTCKVINVNTKHLQSLCCTIDLFRYNNYYPNLKTLKIISNYKFFNPPNKKLIESIDWVKSFPKLQNIYIDTFSLPVIINLQKLKALQYVYPTSRSSLIKVDPNVTVIYPDQN